MTSSHITHQLQLSRIGELHDDAAAQRLANEVEHGHRAGVRTFLVRLLRAPRGRARAAQRQAASDAR